MNVVSSFIFLKMSSNKRIEKVVGTAGFEMVTDGFGQILLNR